MTGFSAILLWSLPAVAQIDEGLVAHYNFENADDLGKDAIGNGPTLEIAGEGGAEAVDGIKGKALELDGFTWLESYEADAIVTGETFSWSLWYKAGEDRESPGGIISKSPDGWAPGAKALFKGEGDDFLGFDVGWVGAAEHEGELFDDGWHHVVITCEFFEEEDGEEVIELAYLAMYVDGAWVGELEEEAEAFGEPEESVFRIGSGSPGDDADEESEAFPEIPFFSGMIDEVRIYNRVLEEEDVIELLKDGLGELPKPEIVGQPADAQGIAGRSAILSVEAEGILLSFQWFKGDAEIEEADGPSLLLEDLSAESAGEYKVVVSNDSGEVTSETANVTVIDEWSPEIGLVAHFKFEDEEDAGKDSSGNDNNIFDEGVVLAEGIKGQALLLERDSRLRDLDEEFELNTHASFTWTAFIKTEDDGGLIAKSPENWSPGSKAIFVREGVLGFDTGWIGDINGETELIDNKWHHVAIVMEAGEEEDAITLYVDGNEDGFSDGMDMAWEDDPGVLSIGFSSNDFPFEEEPELNWFGGQIDEVRVYNQPLIQEDIITLMIEDGGQIQAPAIVDHPVDASATEGRSARFRVTATGTGVQYQWKKNGEDIEDANEATLKVKATKENEASYSVEIFSEYSDVRLTSESAMLKATPRPVFGGGELAHVAEFLESYWNFDSEEDGIVADQIPNSTHAGELRNGAELSEEGEGYGGKGRALDPSAEENAHMLAADAESYDFNSSWTWTARVKLNDIPESGDEVGSGIFGRSPADTGHNNGSKVMFFNGMRLGFDTGWVGVVITETEGELDTWMQITMSYDSEEQVIAMYLNDEVVISEEGEEVIDFEFEVNEFPEDEQFEGGFVNTGFRVGSGANNFYNSPFPGLIDDAAVWSTVLSPEDVALLANGASPMPEVSDNPTLTVSRADSGDVVVEFTGKLQMADSVTGPWEEVAAESPHVIKAGDLKANSFARSVKE